MQDRTDALFDQYLDLVLQGEPVDVERFISDHTSLDDVARDRLRSLASTLADGGTRGSPWTRGSFVTSDSASSSAEDDGLDLGPNEIFGDYRLLRVLGRGGQGVVYLALDTRLSRRVALKVLDRPDLAAFAASSPTGPAARLTREAEVASKLDHPAICVVHEMGVVRNSPYIAMRYVAGETLARKIAAARDSGNAMLALDSHTPVGDLNRERGPGDAELGVTANAGSAPPSKAANDDSIPAMRMDPPGADSSGRRSRRAISCTVHLVEKAARALHAAHRSGVIHRDVKPANIMVTPDGDPVLLDFGLARDQSSEATSLTQTGEIFGSPGYMSPEQIDPSTHGLDRRTDVYSLGVVLYECLTLRRPFEHPTREGLYRAILSEAAPDPRRANRAIDRELAVVLETALEKSPDRRYKSALDFAEDLRRWREYQPILAKPASSLVRLQRWTQRNRVLSASLVVFALLAAWIVNSQRTTIARERENLEQLHGAMLTARSSAELLQDPALALLLSIEGARRNADVTSSSALHTALANLRESRCIQAHSAPIVGLVVCPDGKDVISASKDGRVRVWELDSETQIAEVRSPLRQIDDLEISADGRWIAATSVPDEAVHVWSTASWSGRSGAEVTCADASMPVPGEMTGTIRFSPDGSRVLLWGRHGFAVWNFRT
jgi:serine/threonine protein kinase